MRELVKKHGSQRQQTPWSVAIHTEFGKLSNGEDLLVELAAERGQKWAVRRAQRRASNHRDICEGVRVYGTCDGISQLTDLLPISHGEDDSVKELELLDVVSCYFSELHSPAASDRKLER